MKGNLWQLIEHKMYSTIILFICNDFFLFLFPDLLLNINCNPALKNNARKICQGPFVLVMGSLVFKANMQRKEVECERKKKEEKKRKNKRPKLPVKRHNAAWVKKHSLH